MRKITKEELNNLKTEARKKMITGGLKAFINHDVVLECINPETHEPLVDKNASSQERYLAFKGNKIFYDADVSIEATTIYEEVFPFVSKLDKKEICLQKTFNDYGMKYELANPEVKNGVVFRGDTMNSVATTNMEYYRKHKNKKEFRGKDFKLPDAALTLLDLYHTIGNFMVLPYKYGEGSINATRGKGPSRDYFDLYLMAVYNAYLEMEGKPAVNKITLSFVLWEDEDLIEFMKSYLRSFMEDGKNGWNNFVSLNFFHDFVKERGADFMEPKELWKGHFKTEDGFVKPKTDKQFNEFWTNSSAWIKNRSYRIYRKLQTGDCDTDYFEPVIYNL